MNYTVQNIRPAPAHRVERPMLRVPYWHSSNCRNRNETLELWRKQCAEIARLFSEILFKYHDCGSTRLVVFLAGQGSLPLDAETLMGPLTRSFL